MTQLSIGVRIDGGAGFRFFSREIEGEFETEATEFDPKNNAPISARCWDDVLVEL